jgi:hypothetical protein
MSSFFLWLIIGLLIALPIVAAPSVERRHPGPSWFDLQPYMTPSKKSRGRAQQTHRHGKRRYGT